MKIVVGSKNPVKLECVRLALVKLFPLEDFQIVGCDAQSGISVQPKTSRETLRGAANRAHNARNLVPEADYWVGIEGGIEDNGRVMEEVAWVFVLNKGGGERRSRNTTFEIPAKVAKLIREGYEHGPACDIVFKVENSKQTNGTIGLLSDNALTRTTYYVDSVVCAFIPFKHPEHYSEEG